jgi:hypothetical protein
VAIPAQLVSPRFAGQPLGDLSTPPGARARWFYAAGDTDPAVLGKDTATESVITAGELTTLLLPMALPETNTINVPVLQAVGSQDAIFYCGLSPCSDVAQLRSAEAQHFSAAPSYDTYVLPGSGHDLNLAVNHCPFFRAVSDWVNSRVVAAPANQPRAAGR